MPIDNLLKTDIEIILIITTVWKVLKQNILASNFCFANAQYWINGRCIHVNRDELKYLKSVGY